MVWPFSSSSGSPEIKAEPPQPTPTSIPIRTAPSTSPSTPPPLQLEAQSQSQSQKDDSDFHAANPHLGPSTTTTPSPASSPYDPSLPTTMSCRDAFDSAFYCSSLGGHFNDIYRYGQLRSCSQHWADWRFCMTLKSQTADGKVRAIQAHYKKKEDEVREKPNSENVWRIRRPGEEVRNPFAGAEEEGRRVQGA